MNECQSQPCKNGGSCIDQVNGFKCDCPMGYYDYICESNLNECDSRPCVNGGTCVDGINRLVHRGNGIGHSLTTKQLLKMCQLWKIHLFNTWKR